jgi:arylsulfatase
MLLKEIGETSYAIKYMAYPSFYDLLVDPREEKPKKVYLDGAWAKTYSV